MTPGAGSWSYIIAAFAIAWLGIGGYWIYASRKARRAHAQYRYAAFEDRGTP